MTPEEHIDQLMRIYETGGAEAVGEFSKTNPAEYIEAMVAFCNIESDDESPAELRDSMWATVRSEIIEQLSQGGFAKFDELIRLARGEVDDESVDRLEAFLRRLRN